MKFSFEVPISELRQRLDDYVSAIFSSLESEFLVLPRGKGFVEYSVFDRGYEALKRATQGFTCVAPEAVIPVVLEVPISILVIRTILGFTPPEWAYVTTQRTGTSVTQHFARQLDRRIRLQPFKPLPRKGVTPARVEALVWTACRLITEGVEGVGPGRIHRLDKADTKEGLKSIGPIAEMGVPYAMLLYERYLGRPFAGHRDSISELVGDPLEAAVEDALSESGISYRKTKRAARVPGFDQAPDFVIPSEFNPQVVIEAKITEDDGTARDKITRIQHLAELALAGQPPDQPKYEVIACIGGRGFGVRREDMKKLLLATRGKVFTLRTLDRLVACSRLKDFKSR